MLCLHPQTQPEMMWPLYLPPQTLPIQFETTRWWHRKMMIDLILSTPLNGVDLAEQPPTSSGMQSFAARQAGYLFWFFIVGKQLVSILIFRRVCLTVIVVTVATVKRWMVLTAVTRWMNENYDWFVDKNVKLQVRANFSEHKITSSNSIRNGQSLILLRYHQPRSTRYIYTIQWPSSSINHSYCHMGNVRNSCNDHTKSKVFQLSISVLRPLWGWEVWWSKAKQQQHQIVIATGTNRQVDSTSRIRSLDNH